MASEQQEIADGTLLVRTGKNGDARTIALCGELDLANASTAESALQELLDAPGARVVVDMRELEFIDSTGIAAAVITPAPMATPAMATSLERVRRCFNLLSSLLCGLRSGAGECRGRGRAPTTHPRRSK